MVGRKPCRLPLHHHVAGWQQLSIRIFNFNVKKYDYDSTIYVDKGILDSLRVYLNQYYSKLKILANDKYKNYEIVPTDKVESGCAYVNDAEKYNYKNDRIRGTKLNITASNIYYEKELELTITNTFTEYNFK